MALVDIIKTITRSASFDIEFGSMSTCRWWTSGDGSVVIEYHVNYAGKYEYVYKHGDSVVVADNAQMILEIAH